MRAQLLLKEKDTDGSGNLTELVIWSVPLTSKYPDGIRYRFAFVPLGMSRPVILYDNHYPKGPHKHLMDVEEPYQFESTEKALFDFKDDVKRWRERENLK